MIYNLSFAKVPVALRDVVASKLCELLTKHDYPDYAGLIQRLNLTFHAEKNFCLVFHPERTGASWNPTPFDAHRNTILHVVEDWEQINTILCQLAKKVTLNSEYTALVRDTHVEVGCQKITFDKIRELYKLLPPE